MLQRIFRKSNPARKPFRRQAFVCLMCLLGLMGSFGELARAAAPNALQTGEMDLAPVFKLNAIQKKTLPENPTPPAAPGVVGLDLLIFPSDYPLVQNVFPNTSAEKQGMLPGDQIVQINQQSTLGKSRNQIDQLISDKVGEKVHLLITRNQQLKTITLTVSPAPSSLGW